MKMNQSAGFPADVAAGAISPLKAEELSTHLQVLITSLEDIVFEFNGNYVFKNVWVSDESTLFMPKAAFLGKKIPEVMGPLSEMIVYELTEVMKTNAVRECVYKHLDPTMNQWYRLRIKPAIVSPDPEHYIMVASVQDVTDKKLAEIELEEARLKLIEAKNIAESSAKAKTDFLSVMSHEIRTPLNGIIGIANLLKLNHTMDQEQYVKSLIFSADHLLRLINDILDLTKIESDKLELVKANVNVFELIRNIKNQFKSLAENKGIQLKSFIDDDIPQHLVADPIRLAQILNNLVSNAIKFTEEGEVVIMLQLTRLKSNLANIHFSIKDTGLGIPKELHETVFESFKQVQQSAHRKHSGTGLGLTITQKLIELHNSAILLESEPGKGTKFYFDIEFEVASEQQDAVPYRGPAHIQAYEKKLTGLRILFAEDNPINVMVAQKQLEFFGIHPDCAYSGKDALSLLENNEYDIALLDLHMPEIDGYALAEIIRKQYPSIHIIIFTADIMTEVKVRLAQMNIYDILNKPFSAERMYEMLLNVGVAKGVIKK